jgi:hypothetical protein
MNVAREMGRLIRLSYNGHLPPEELTKYVFALDKLRACLESAEAQAAAAAAKVPPVPSKVSISIISVPSGCHFNNAQMEQLSRGDTSPLQIEHENGVSVEDYARNVARQAEEPPPIEVRSPAEAKLLAELDSLTDQQLMERAIRCGLDPSLLSSSSRTSAD